MSLNKSPTSLESRPSPAVDGADLHTTIHTQEQSLLAPSDDHLDEPPQLSEPGKPTPSDHLENPLWLAASYLAQVAALTPDDHPEKLHRLYNLGVAYLHRFERFGMLDDLDNATSSVEQVLMFTPDDHPDKPIRLGALGTASRLRFERLGRLGDLDKAVSCLERAVLLTPDYHPNKSRWLGPLGAAYQLRFERLGRLDDLDKAVTCLEQAELPTPDDHPDKSHRLGTLGATYHHRFRRLGRLDDLNEATSCLKRAVMLTPDGHPDKPRWLSELGVILHYHEAKFLDLKAPATYQGQAVPLTPDGHPDKPRESVRNVVIHSLMSAPDVIRHLGEHGCPDITESLDIDSCTSRPLSVGGFGEVYRGKLNQTLVAIKILRSQVDPSEDCQKHLKHAARELNVWSKCRHPNVLPLLGLVVFRDQVGMVSQWLEHGSLTSYIRQNQEIDRCKMSQGIADGLAYLHGVPIVHGDLKGPNVLIADDGTPMLTDFGNAVLQNSTLNFTTTTQKEGMSIRWAAPELLDGREGGGICSTAADVYALGMTILETFTGRVPYFGKPDIVVLSAVAMRKEIPARPEAQILPGSQQGELLWSLLQRCWVNEPKDRPDASKVAEIMRGITREGLMITVAKPSSVAPGEQNRCILIG